MFGKILGFLFLMNLITINSIVFGQNGKYGATDEDSVTCIENLSVYKDFLRDGQFAKAKSYWGKAYRICPKSSLKMYVDGEKILNNMIKENKENKERVTEIVDTLLLLYDVRIEHFGKEGYVLGKKGVSMYKHKYPSYQEAFNTLQK